MKKMLKLQDHSDFYDFGPVTQNDRTDTSTSAEIEVCTIYEIKCFN